LIPVKFDSIDGNHVIPRAILLYYYLVAIGTGSWKKKIKDIKERLAQLGGVWRIGNQWLLLLYVKTIKRKRRSSMTLVRESAIYCAGDSKELI
jgi:hypothetical protein